MNVITRFHHRLHLFTLLIFTVILCSCSDNGWLINSADVTENNSAAMSSLSPSGRLEKAAVVDKRAFLESESELMRRINNIQNSPVTDELLLARKNASTIENYLEKRDQILNKFGVVPTVPTFVNILPSSMIKPAGGVLPRLNGSVVNSSSANVSMQSNAPKGMQKTTWSTCVYNFPENFRVTSYAVEAPFISEGLWVNAGEAIEVVVAVASASVEPTVAILRQNNGTNNWPSGNQNELKIIQFAESPRYRSNVYRTWGYPNLSSYFRVLVFATTPNTRGNATSISVRIVGGAQQYLTYPNQAITGTTLRKSAALAPIDIRQYYQTQASGATDPWIFAFDKQSYTALSDDDNYPQLRTTTGLFLKSAPSIDKAFIEGNGNYVRSRIYTGGVQNGFGSPDVILLGGYATAGTAKFIMWSGSISSDVSEDGLGYGCMYRNEYPEYPYGCSNCHSSRSN